MMDLIVDQVMDLIVNQAANGGPGDNLDDGSETIEAMKVMNQTSVQIAISRSDDPNGQTIIQTIQANFQLLLLAL